MMQVACRMFKFKQLIKNDITCKTDFAGSSMKEDVRDQTQLINYVKIESSSQLKWDRLDGLYYVENQNLKGSKMGTKEKRDNRFRCHFV